MINNPREETVVYDDEGYLERSGPYTHRWDLELVEVRGYVCVFH